MAALKAVIVAVIAALPEWQRAAIINKMDEFREWGRRQKSWVLHDGRRGDVTRNRTEEAR